LDRGESVEAAESQSIAIFRDGVCLVEPQNIIGEALESGEDAWV